MGHQGRGRVGAKHRDHPGATLTNSSEGLTAVWAMGEKMPPWMIAADLGSRAPLVGAVIDLGQIIDHGVWRKSGDLRGPDGPLKRTDQGSRDALA